MLYVIATDNRGRVVKAMPCNSGIDRALQFIANELVGPEEDWAVIHDGIVNRWNDAVHAAELDGGTAYEHFAIDRGKATNRYGIVVVDEPTDEPTDDLCLRRRAGWTCMMPTHDHATPHVAWDTGKRICAAWFTAGPMYHTDIVPGFAREGVNA